MRRLLVSVNLVCFFIFAALCSAACAESYVQGEVPIYYITDRRPKNLDVGDWSPDQIIASHSIGCGVVRVPVRVPLSYKPDCLKRFGCLVNAGGKATFIKSSIRAQIAKQDSIALSFGTAGSGKSSLGTYRMEFLKKFHDYVVDCGNNSFVLFVHGCCTPVEDSFIKAAELAVYLQRPVLVFDWATPGLLQALPLPEINTYRRSERVLEISQHNFYELMSALPETLGDLKCIVVAHSMGNRLVYNDMLQRSLSGKCAIDQLHMINADISLPAYILDEDRVCKLAKEVYIYTSDKDPWLRKAQMVSAGVPRLGCPRQLLDLIANQGMNFDLPGNRYFLDLSALRLGHSLPFDVIAELADGKLSKANSKFVTKPRFEPYAKKHVLFVRPK